MQRHIWFFMVLLFVCDFVASGRLLQMHIHLWNGLVFCCYCCCLASSFVLLFFVSSYECSLSLLEKKSTKRSSESVKWSEKRLARLQSHIRKRHNVIRSFLSRSQTKMFITFHVPFDSKVLLLFFCVFFYLLAKSVFGASEWSLLFSLSTNNN